MLSKDDQKAVDALLRGQGCANHLKTMIENGSFPMESLVDTILDSFSLALSLMISSVPPPPTPQHESSSSSQNLAPKKSLKLKREICGREGGLKQYRDDCLSPLINDGFSWRKYGQKTIKTSPYQRSYYRCAYAKEQNCIATKRVQQIQDSPSVHRTTYVGKHICEEVRNFSHQPNDDVTNGSKMIWFDKLDQAMSKSSVMPQLVPVDHQAIAIEFIDQHLNQECAMPQLVSIELQETIEDEGTDQIMNQECDYNELVDYGDQFLTYPYSPENCMFLDDISVFDYIPSQV